MRKYFTWFGIILCVSVLFAVEVGATVPFADDLPDVRLIRQGSGGTPETMAPAFDLDDYVIDNQQTDDSISWSSSVEAGGPAINIDTVSDQLALHEVDVAAVAAAGLYDATFTANAAGDTDEAVSTVKYSEFWLTEPKFTADNRLSFAGADLPRFTYVKLFDGSGAAEDTPALDGSVSPAQTVDFGPLTMYDLTSGAPVREDQGQTVAFGGLGAWVNGNTGAVSLTPSGALSCAVLISIPAVLDGSSFSRGGNWDGAVIMVAPAVKGLSFNSVSGSGDPYETSTLAQDCRFEDIPGTAAVQPDGTPSNSSPQFITGGWRFNGGYAGLTAASIGLVSSGNLGVAGTPANQFAGATSGNALQIAFTPDAAGMGADISSFKLTSVQPGEIYGMSMNIATDIPSAQMALYSNNVKFILQTYIRGDQGYFAGTVVDVAQTTADQQSVGMPVDGQWRQIYMEFRVPELSYALDNTYIGGTGTSNVSSDGFLLFFRASAKANTPAFNVYIDNVYTYCKGMSDLNYADVNDSDDAPIGLIEEGLANGVTAFATYNAINPAVNGDMVDNTFESGASLALNNWRETGSPGYVNVGTPTGQAGIASFGRLNTGGSLELYLTGGTPASSSDGDGIRVATRPIGIRGQTSGDVAILDANGDPIPDLAGEGYYGVSFWMTSNAASCVSNPQVKVYLNEQKPSPNQLTSFSLLGPSNVPAQPDGWYQYSFVGAYPRLGGDRPMLQAIVVIDVGARGGFANRPGGGDYVGTSVPGYNATSHVYIDDLVVHRVRDTNEYWNASLFE